MEARCRPLVPFLRPPGALRASAHGHGGADAYEFWRSTVFYNFEADPPDREASGGFSARLRGLISRKVEFYDYESSALSGRRTRAHIAAGSTEELDIGLVVQGCRRSRDDNGDDDAVTCPGEFFTYDSAQPCLVEWDHHRVAHLSFNRGDLKAALGFEVPSQRHIQAALRTSCLAPFLRSQLLTLQDNLDRLGDWERDIVLDSIMDLTVNVLRSALADVGAAEREREQLFNAARALVRRRAPVASGPVRGHDRQEARLLALDALPRLRPVQHVGGRPHPRAAAADDAQQAADGAPAHIHRRHSRRLRPLRRAQYEPAVPRPLRRAAISDARRTGRGDAAPRRKAAPASGSARWRAAIRPRGWMPTSTPPMPMRCGRRRTRPPSCTA